MGQYGLDSVWERSVHFAIRCMWVVCLEGCETSDPLPEFLNSSYCLCVILTLVWTGVLIMWKRPAGKHPRMSAQQNIVLIRYNHHIILQRIFTMAYRQIHHSSSWIIHPSLCDVLPTYNLICCVSRLLAQTPIRIWGMRLAASEWPGFVDSPLSLIGQTLEEADNAASETLWSFDEGQRTVSNFSGMRLLL